MRNDLLFATIFILITSMIAGCVEEDVVENDVPSSDPVISSMTLYPMNGTNHFLSEGKNTTCLHHDDDIVFEMYGSCFNFYTEVRLMDFEPQEMPLGDLMIMNATLQLEYRNNFIVPENRDSTILIFNWSFIGANRTIQWAPRLSESDIVDNITLFSNEFMMKEDLSTFSLHLRIRAGVMGGQRLIFDRIVIIVDYTTNPIVLR